MSQQNEDIDASRNLTSQSTSNHTNMNSKRKTHNFMKNMHMEYYKSINPNNDHYTGKGGSWFNNSSQNKSHQVHQNINIR